MSSSMAFGQTRGVEFEGQMSKEFTYREVADFVLTSVNKNAQVVFGRFIKNVKVSTKKSKNNEDAISLFYELNGRKYNWSIEADRSIIPDSFNLQGVEIVSPILYSALDVQLYALVIQDLNRLHGFIPQANTSGLHVHIGIPNLEMENLIRLLGLFAKVEDILFELFAVNADRIKYASKTKALYNKLKNNENLRLESIFSDNDLRLNIATRYYGLNLLSLFKYKTVEFRLFNSTVIASDIAYITEMCRRLVQISFNDKDTVNAFLEEDFVSLEKLVSLLKMNLNILKRENHKLSYSCEKLF